MEKKPVVRYFYKGEWLEATVSDIGDMTALLTQSKNSIVAAINELYATGGFGNGKIPQNVQEKLDEINGAVEGINDFINSGGLNDTMAQQVQDKLNGVNIVINEYIRQVQDELSKDLSDARKEYADKVQTVENALEGAKQSIADSASALEKLKNDLIEIDLNVTTVSQEVDTIKGELSTKVETSDFDLAQAQIRQNTTNISQNANEIAMKVSEDTFNAATERITQAEAALVVQANLIESKVTREEVREEIDKIDKYRPNLFKRTRDWEGFVPRDKTKFSVTSNTYKQCHIANFTTNGTGCYQIVEDLVIGETYTISVFASSTSSTAVVGAKVGTKVIPMAPIDGAPISTTMNRYSGSFVAGTDSTIEILFRASSGSMAAPKLEKGKDASPWQPHVDDDYAKIVVNETSIKQTDDRITQTVKTIEQQGEDIEINSTAINQLGDSIGLQANKITDIEGKVVDNTANLNIAFNQISTKVSQTDVDSSIADISLDGSNKILNSDFGDDFENWYEVSPQFRIVDFSGMKCASVERSGLTADLTLSLATNKFALSNGERLMFGFGFGTKDKTKIDKPLIARLEIFDINDVRVDTVDINLNQVTGLVNGKISRFNGVYLCERADAAKARLKFQLARNGSVYFTRPMAQLGSIASTDWSLNPEDLVQRKIKYESAIEQTADRITSTVKEYTDGEVSKAVAQAAADFTTANNAAKAAQDAADAANTSLTNLSKDTILSPIEKKDLAKEWEAIKSDYVLVKAQCVKYAVADTTLTSRYNTLNTYVPPLLSSMTTNSTIVPATFRANFKNYYDEKVKALNLVADKVRSLSQSEFETANNNAIAAQTSANAANTAITNFSKDTILTPIEKKDLAKEWESIKSDYVLVKAQCDKYGVPVSTLTTRYNTLNTYVPPLLTSMSANSTIVPATFRANFKNYYDEKVKALNLVADMVRTLSIADFETANNNAIKAQNAANTANNNLTNISKDTVLSAIEKKDVLKEWEEIKSDYLLVKAQCEKYSVAATTLTSNYNKLDTYITPLLSSMTSNSTIVPATFRSNFKNYYDEKVRVLNLVADMVRALSIEDFETANNNALKAQTAANTANTNLTNISKDTILSPIEKKDLAKEWATIQSDYSLVKAQCDKYSVAATNLTTRYNTLNTYVPPLLTSMTTNTTIVPATFRANFKNYYDEKVKALNLIADKVKALGDTAASDALKTAKSYADSKIEQTATSITSTVKSYTDAEVGKVNQKVDGMEIGGRNYFLKSDVERTYSREFVNSPTWDMAPLINEYGIDQWYTVSFDLKSKIAGRIDVYSQNGSGTKYDIGTLVIQATTTFKRYSYSFKPKLSNTTLSQALLAFFGTYDSGRIPTVKKVKFELGNKATDWSPAPEDVLKDAGSYTDSEVDKAKEQAKADFNTANNAAKAAQSAADKANTNLTDISKDTILSPIEKKDLAKEWDSIKSDYTLVKAQAEKYSVATTNLVAKYTTLNSYVPPLLTSMTTNSTIVPATFRANFKNYNDEKIKVLNLVADKVKELGDKAASDALNAAKTYAESKIEQTADSITSEVTNYTDSEIEGLREYTDSKIEQTADSITTEVKEYTTEEVGKLNYYEAYSNSPNGEQDFTLVLPKRNFCDGSEFTDGKWKFESNQDERLHTAYAWSADGTDRFTPVYPRENLIINSGNFKTLAPWSGGVLDTTTFPFPTLKGTGSLAQPENLILKSDTEYVAIMRAYFTAEVEISSNFPFHMYVREDGGIPQSGRTYMEIVGGYRKAIPNTWETIIIKFKTIASDKKITFKPHLYHNNWKGAERWLQSVMLVESREIPDFWIPNPAEDYANAYPLYEGTYTDYSETASQNPADYTWKAVSKQNIPVYSHTAYSWSEDGQNRFTDRYPKENLLSMENLGVWPLNTELAVIEGTQKVTLNSTSTENLGVHCQNETTIKIGEKYTLSYELKVLSGTVIQIGGHIYGYNQEGKVKVNGTEVDGTYATGFPYSLAAGSTNKIELKLVGSGVSGTLSDGVYIQPNRGAYTTSFNAEVTNIKLEKGHDGATIYTPSPIDDEAECYPTYIGKYTDNLEVASSNPAAYSWQEITGDRYVHRSFSSSLDGTKNFSTEFPNENLLLDSDAISLTAENAEFGRYFSDSTLTELTCSFVKEANAPSPSKYVVQGTSLGGNSDPMAARSIAWHDGGGQITLEVGETYTMSCMARLVSGSGRLRFQYGINPYYNNFQEIHSSEWRQYSWTFTAEQPSTRIYMPAGSAHLPGVIQTCCFKLEKGTVATSYTPALSEGLRDTYPSFMGTYSDEEEDDSNSSEDYNWTFLLNNDGKYDLSNKDRTPIVNEEISYCLGGDNFIPPKNGWSAEIPVMARDYLLYSKTVWTFKDGLSETAFRVHEIGRHGSNGLPKTYDFKAKMVYEHSAYSWSIDGTERFAYMYPRENLIKNSSFKQSITNIWDSVGTSPIELETVDGYDALKIELTSSNPSGVNTGDDLKSLVTDGKLSIGDIVSYQMLMKADVDSTDVFVGLQGAGINNATPVNLGVDWKLVTIENEVFQDDNTSMRVYSTNSTNKGTNVYIANVKLERGRSCTVYTPKPSENPSAAYPMYIGTYESNDIENSRKPELYSWRQIEPGMMADSGTATINKQGSLSLSSQEVDQPSMSLDGISDDSDYVLSIYAKATVESDVRLRLIEYVYTDKAPTSTVWIDSLQTVGTEWGRIHASCLIPKNTVEKDNYWVVSIETFQPSGTVDIKQVKLETGTEPTTFLKAPEENETESRMQYKGISLVGGEEFESYTWFPMTANDIDLHEVLKKVNEASANMTRFEQDFDSFEFKVVNPFISSTNDMLGNIESYMRFSDSGLKLGRSDSPFFVNLSGTELGFYNSPNYDPRKTDISEVEDDKIAWINGSELHIKMAIIENTIQLGRHTIDKLESKPDITVVRFAG